MIKPLNGEKSHPLTPHALQALVALMDGPKPCQTFNPGVVNRLLRGELVESVARPSPYKTHAGRSIEHLQLTAAGREEATRRQTCASNSQ